MISGAIAEGLVNKSFEHISDLVVNELTDIKFEHSSAERINSKKITEQFHSLTYEDYFKDNKIRASSYSKNKIDGKLEILSKALCYIPMSTKRVKEHVLTYVIDSSNNTIDCDLLINDSDTHVINSSRQKANCIMSFWESRARQLAGQVIENLKFELPNDDLKLTRFILRGKPGVGKTAYLNYSFSVYSDSLIKNNIIWIRADLSKPRGSDLGLRTQMYAKFIRIFCDFYLNNDSFPFDDLFIKDLQSELVSQAKKLKSLTYRKKDPSQLAEDYVGLLGNIYDILKERDRQPPNRRGGAPEVTSFYTEFDLTTQIANKFTEILMAYIQNKYQFGFILVFDGLDSVSMDYVQIDIFQKWIGQLDGTSDNSSNMFKAVYITTMRDYSYIYLYKESPSHKIRNEFREFCIAPRRISDVLLSRSKYASLLFEEQGLNIPENVVRNVYHNIILLLYKSTDFGDQTEGDPVAGEKYFRHFHDLNNDNLRAAFRFMREFIYLLYDMTYPNIYEDLSRKILPDELVKNIKSREWEVLRLLLFGDSTIRLYKNRIQFSAFKTEFDIDLSKPGLIKIDNHNRAVIPNIFNYREVAYDNSQLFLKNLFKLRVIQYLLQQKGCRAGVLEIIDWYKTFFAYKGNDLRFEIREMIYNGILSPECDELSISYNEINNLSYMVTLSELGKSILSSVINKSIYYEIICDDTPIQRDFSYYMNAISKWDKNVSSDEYIITKTKMVIFFLFYLQKVEGVERDIYKSIDSITNYNSKFFIFTEKVISYIKLGLIKSISGHMTARKDRGLNWRKEFIFKWKREFGFHEDFNFFN